MSYTTPTLHLLCGKIAAGKSTLAQRLAVDPHTVLLCEDVWLSQLYPGEIQSVTDYVTCSAKLRDAVGPHVKDLLRGGLSVVLDFPANTPDLRRWMRSLIDGASVPHVLHVLDVPDGVCKARLQERNEAGDHAFAPSEADFDLITQYFVPPSAEEGFAIKMYGKDG